MKLQQLRYLCEIVDQGLNVTRAAAVLHTSQPGVSKQIRLLEQELGAPVLERRGTRVTGLAPAGRAILATARRMLLESDRLRRQAREAEAPARLVVATTHTHARYAVLPVFKRFTRRHPEVALELRQASPPRIAQLVAAGEADIGIATEASEPVPGIVREPCYRLYHRVIVPTAHELLREQPVTLEQLARFPLITYDTSFRLGGVVRERFASAGLEPVIAISAIDSDIIKAYVEAGFGVAILPSVAYDRRRDTGLRALSADHLFPSSTCFVMMLEGRDAADPVHDFARLVKSIFGKV